MSTTTTTTTTTMHISPNPRPPKRTPVPLLLESFPVPPSHIPPTPTTPVPPSSSASTPTTSGALNPPPSGPPSTPLPPVPGPSRISEHEQLLLLSSAVNRSRRSSKYSVTSSSQRESVISVSSSGVHGGSASSRTSFASDGARSPPAAKSAPLPALSGSPKSIRDRDSTLSSSSGSSTHGRPSISISSSSPASATTRLSLSAPDQPQLTRLTISPMPLSDIEDDDDEGLGLGSHHLTRAVPPPVMPSPTRAASQSQSLASSSTNGAGNRDSGSNGIRLSSSSSSSSRHHHQSHHHHQANESISSIDMRDLLGLDTLPDEDEENEPLGGLPPPPPRSHSSVKSKFSSIVASKFVRHQHQASLADPIDPHTIYTRTKPEDRPLPNGTAAAAAAAAATASSSSPTSSATFTPTQSQTQTSSGAGGHRSSPSIGSFSLPSRSKNSPIAQLAPFVPSSSGMAGHTVPASPPALRRDTTPLPTLSSSYAYSYVGGEEAGMPPSVSTTTQFSNTSISSSPLLEASPLPESTDDLESILTTTSLSQPSIASSSSSTSLGGLTSPTVKDMRLGLRAERTRSAGLKHVLRARSRSRSVAKERERRPEPGGGLPPVPLPVLGGALPAVPGVKPTQGDDGLLKPEDIGADGESNGGSSARDSVVSATGSASGSTSSGVGLGLTGDEMGKVLSGIVITTTTKREVVEGAAALPAPRNAGAAGNQGEMTLEELGPAPPHAGADDMAPATPSSPQSILKTPSQIPPTSPKRSNAFPPQRSTRTARDEEGAPTPRPGGAPSQSQELPPPVQSQSEATPRPLSKSTSTPKSVPAPSTTTSPSKIRKSSTSSFQSTKKDPRQNKVANADNADGTRSPSPDIATILSRTPRPLLSKSASAASASSRNRKSAKDKGARARVSSLGSVSAAGSTAVAHGHGQGSGHARSRSRSRSRSKSRTRASGGGRRVSEGASSVANQYGSLSRTSTTSSRYSAASATSTASAPTSALMGRAKSMGTLRGTGTGTAGARGEEDDAYDEELEKVLEGVGSEDDDGEVGEGGGESDSSLDLHTPLPHLMVRDGLLSPNSKLLPGAASRAATPMDGRPGSMLSVVSQGSVMTKSGIIKDERDTPMRRVRHRDGKLLRGGIGLTTGLGWSDSEDEDAPSPLTRRLSSLNLSRRSSASSIMTGTTSASRPPGSFGQRHPLSRSFSSGALSEHQQSRRSFPRHEFDEFDDDYLEEEDEEGDMDNTLKETGEWAQAQRQRSRIPSGGSSILSRPPSKSSLPPTSWQHRTTTSGVSGISRSSGGTVASRTSRTSTSSVGSTFSLEVTTPDGEARTKTPSLSRIRTPSGGAHGLGLRRDSTESSGAAAAGGGVGIGRPSAMKKGSRDDVSVTTPSSTASTLSIPMPATPKDAAQDVGEDEMSASTTPVPGSKIRLGYNKDKSLPPLPLRSVPSLSRVDGTTTTRSTTPSSGIAAPGSKFAFPRARTFSSTSSASASASTPSPPSAIPKTSTSPTSPKVRPLQLPRHAARAAGDRPAVPVPSVLSSASRGSLRTPSLGSATLSPTSPNSASASVPSSPLPSPDLNGAGTGIAKPKPRTGTGMVYRSSSSKMRPPMVLSSSMSSGISASASTGSNAATVGSIGRAGSGIGKPIAL